jgi:hypothetical protein
MVVAAKEVAKIKVTALAKIYFVKGRDSHYLLPLVGPFGRCLSLYLLNAKYIFIFSFQVLSLAFDQPRAKEIKELSSN